MLEIDFDTATTKGGNGKTYRRGMAKGWSETAGEEIERKICLDGRSEWKPYWSWKIFTGGADNCTCGIDGAGGSDVVSRRCSGLKTAGFEKYVEF
jgi:hypothetical protein